VELGGSVISQNEFMHVFTATKGEQLDFDLLFTPSTGKKGETISLFFSGIFMPSYKMTSEDYASYGVYHRAGRSLPFPVTMNADAVQTVVGLSNAKIENIPQSVLESYQLDNGTSELDFRPMLELLDQNGEKADKIVGKDSVSLTLRAYGGSAAGFRATVFINHKAVKVDGKDYLEYTVEKGKWTTSSFNIDITDLERISSLYVLSTPIGSDYKKEYASIQQTTPMMLINEAQPEAITPPENISNELQASDISIAEPPASQTGEFSVTITPAPQTSENPGTETPAAQTGENSGTESPTPQPDNITPLPSGNLDGLANVVENMGIVYSNAIVHCFR
jgi:hypothetical protein